MTSKHRNGFTLIEISIVLVIIGLVIGVFMGGQVMIKAAKIRDAAAELEHYSSAYNAFELKYGCIMGDCPNATDFFGPTYVSASTYPGCTGATNGIGNGDGDGFLSSGGAAVLYCESVFAMRALILSNLFPTTLLDRCPNSSVYLFYGINDGCAYFLTDDVYNATPAQGLNTITWSRSGTSTGAAIKYPTISPVEAKGIDDKIDDGIPNAGKFYGLDTAYEPAGTGVTVANSCRTSGVYNTNETKTCRTVYYLE